MKPVSTKTIVLIATVLILAIPIAIFTISMRKQLRQEYRSPDGRFTLAVYSYPMLFAMPGQGSDAPGIVYLRDKNGRNLQRVKIEMVQQVEFAPVEWTQTNVRVKLLLDWKLPP